MDKAAIRGCGRTSRSQGRSYGGAAVRVMRPRNLAANAYALKTLE